MVGRGEEGRGAGGAHAIQRWPISVMVLAVATGFLFVMAAVNADGDDLRPTGGDVSSLLNERSRKVDDLRDTARGLRDEIDGLSKDVPSTDVLDDLRTSIEKLRDLTGLTALTGPGLRVVLTDAPRGQDTSGIDPNLLVVHEQDIQAFVNALWAGGAKAVTLQGQRLITTTGIKCVGNTVLLDGVPYAPPYRIEAIGDVPGMVASLDQNPQTVIYADYSREHGLGLEVTNLTQVEAPAYAGTVSLQHAAVADVS